MLKINKLQNFFKKALIVIATTASAIAAVVSLIPIAFTYASSSILGTNTALGSPILNDNFTIEDWNKWEMICWGTFLSNFCVPLVDDYETAFQTGVGGSNGSGFKALAFGSGNDPSNNETIKNLLDYACVQQNASKQQIYVQWTEFDYGHHWLATGNAIDMGQEQFENVADAYVDPNEDSSVTLEPATFQDMWFVQGDNGSGNKGISNQTWIDISEDAPYDTQREYPELWPIIAGNIPTFYIRNATTGQYVKVWDYLDSWDAQMIAAMTNAIRNGQTYASTTSGATSYIEAFSNAFESFWSADTEIYLDPFGNILVGDKVLIPASVNHHLHEDGDINLINSYVMNGYNSTYSNDQVTLGLRQTIYDLFLAGWFQGASMEYGTENLAGLPALGYGNFQNTGFLLYDTDTLVWQYEFDDTLGSMCYGDLVLDLFNSNIDDATNEYNLKFEISGYGLDLEGNTIKDLASRFVLTSSLTDSPIEQTIVAADFLGDVDKTGSSGHNMLYELELTDGTKLPLISKNAAVVPIQLETTTESAESKTKTATKVGAVRNYYNYLYKIYSGQIDTDKNSRVTKSDVESGLDGAFISILKENTKTLWWNAFRSYDNRYYNMEYDDIKKYIDSDSARLIKVYPISNEMRAISQIFSLADGAAFAQYSTYIYVTYLDWYGVTSSTSQYGTTTKDSKFNKEIYDENTSDVLKANADEFLDAKSQEDLENEVLNYSYLMLHPELGREYRQQMIESTIADWIFDQYQRIVYGGYSETYDGSTSKSNSGFLNIETYSDNFLTGWFLDGYVDIVVWLMMGCIIAIIIIGLLKSKKASWFVVSILVIINSLLLVPSMGDIVPYVTSNAIQRMFSSKMTFWSISQGISNATLEAETKSNTGYMSGLTEDEATTVLKVVKQLSSVYTDRSLMVKQDISQKVIQRVTGTYSDIQSIQSARWILPMVMQQFTGDNNTADYIYKPIANIWDDMSNMYWIYNRLDADAVTAEQPTATSQDNSGYYIDTADLEAEYDKLNTYFADINKSGHVTGRNDDTYGEENYKNWSYTLHNGEPYNITHLMFCYLPDEQRHTVSIADSLGSDLKNYTDADSWQSYIDEANNQLSSYSMNWETTVSGGFEETADVYDRSDRSSVTSDLPYLLSTESPIYYFYCMVKDCFGTDASTLGSVISQLQGKIQTNADGEEVRANFMYDTVYKDESQLSNNSTAVIEYNGYVRDVLDLEEMFTNTLPYMYEMTLITGGFDGESGILEDKTIEDMAYYEGELQSWMYRCNWAVKLMENPDYSKSSKIGLQDGTSVTLKNQVMPQAYEEAGRPMVFSEAQMYAQDLTEKDLSTVELLCIEANKRVARQWTLLINYAGTGGLTKEVLMRQMATDATLIFCDEFSSTGVLNTMYTLYPQSLDLRYLSFDSMMKMLVLNITQNTSYIYSDTMSTLIEDESTFTCALLLLDAFLCAYLIPFVRTLLMAVIFYLGVIAMIRAIFTDPKYKAKVSGGQFIMNILFIVYTLLYYASFAAMMAITNTDEVLSTSRIQASSGNPVWLFIIMLLVGLAYTVLMGWQIWFLFKHNRDMGFEALSMAANRMVEGVGDALGRAGGKISNFFSSSSTTNNNTSNTESIKGTGRAKKEPTDVNVTKSAKEKVQIDTSDEMKDGASMDPDYMVNYSSVQEDNNADAAAAQEIDEEIKIGEQMEAK